MAQYQHYIPQFLLRNFSHPYKPPKGRAPKKRGKFHGERHPFRGEKVLDVVDLTSDEPQLLEQPVSRWFGQEDMYKDIADTIKSEKDVEQKLSRLECHTAVILQKVKKAQEKGEAGIWLTRVEVMKLRKFLFVMKYRGLSFYQKYFYEDPQMYDSEDKNLLRAYMAHNGMARPRDVWLHNLRTILDIDMDAEGKWVTTLPELMFPADAEMFHWHTRGSYMAFCTPAEKQDEFILTDECYNIFEGTNNEAYCARTGEFLGLTHLCYHEFGPVSPQLIIVLRSFVLPEALEDMNPNIQKAREKWQKGAAAQFPEPDNVTSILSDLPVAKARNSYTRVVNGRLELAPGATETRCSDDRFCFQFWPISPRHVDTINSIFFDNLLRCKSVVYGSTPPFKRTLEAYMTASGTGFKTVGTGERRARISRRDCLEKLSTVLRMLKSESVPVWPSNEAGQSKQCIQFFDDVWLETMKAVVGNGSDEFNSTSETISFWQAYYKLGGSQALFIKDLDQAWRLFKLEALVFASTEYFNDVVRKQARMNVLDFIVQSHPRRVWLYVKHRRWMLSDEYAMHQAFYVGSAPIFAAKTKALFKTEREDDIVIKAFDYGYHDPGTTTAVAAQQHQHQQQQMQQQFTRLETAVTRIAEKSDNTETNSLARCENNHVSSGDHELVLPVSFNTGTTVVDCPNTANELLHFGSEQINRVSRQLRLPTSGRVAKRTRRLLKYMGVTVQAIRTFPGSKQNLHM